MILFVAFTIFVLFVISDVMYVVSEQQQAATWSFGENLKTGDRFSYRICEYSLHIPELPEPCYDIVLHFLHLLPETTGHIWIVAIEILHNQKQINTVFHIDADSFEINSDGTTIQYANSLERTLEWIKKYAHKMRPQTLSVGKPWGIVATDGGMPITLTVSQADFMTTKIDDFMVYKVGYEFTKESYVYVKDGFPFPLEMTIHKPISGQIQPLMFTATMTSYSASSVFCDPPIQIQQVPWYFGAKIGLEKDSMPDQNKPTQSYRNTAKQGDNLIFQSKATDGTENDDYIDSAIISYEEFLEVIKNMTGRDIPTDASSHNKTATDNVGNIVSKPAENKTKSMR